MIDAKPGILVTCNRCGGTKFVETEDNDEYTRSNIRRLNGILCDGWTAVNLPKSIVLCTKCYAEFVKILEKISIDCL